MKVKIITVGHKPPTWVSEAVSDYSTRFPRDIELVWHECKPAQRASGVTSEKAMQSEANSIRAALPNNARLVVLDEKGEDLDSKRFSERFARWRDAGDPVAIVIGGADGIAPELKQVAHEKIRLSSMTLPHALVRVFIAEQLFRAWSMLNNHPYHRV